eukprot:3300523-Rhodomonas_salina.2
MLIAVHAVNVAKTQAQVNIKAKQLSQDKRKRQRCSTTRQRPKSMPSTHIPGTDCTATTGNRIRSRTSKMRSALGGMTPPAPAAPYPAPYDPTSVPHKVYCCLGRSFPEPRPVPPRPVPRVVYRSLGLYRKTRIPEHSDAHCGSRRWRMGGGRRVEGMDG